MAENESGAKERVIRGVEEVGRGVIDLGGGVFEAAESVAGSVKGTIKSRLPNDGQARENVVMVRVDNDTLNRMDELIETGRVRSRSEAANYLITEGVKSHQSFFDAVAVKMEEIRKAREELRVLLEGQGGK